MLTLVGWETVLHKFTLLLFHQRRGENCLLSQRLCLRKTASCINDSFGGSRVFHWLLGTAVCFESTTTLGRDVSYIKHPCWGQLRVLGKKAVFAGRWISPTPSPSVKRLYLKLKSGSCWWPDFWARGGAQHATVACVLIIYCWGERQCQPVSVTLCSCLPCTRLATRRPETMNAFQHLLLRLKTAP